MDGQLMIVLKVTFVFVMGVFSGDIIQEIKHSRKMKKARKKEEQDRLNSLEERVKQLEAAKDFEL